MADGRVSYPSVFAVDRGTTLPPPLPPKPGQTQIRNRRNRLIQNTLLLLVCLALCGLLVEGCFIYNLYKANNSTKSEEQNSEPQTAARKGEPYEEKPVTKKPRSPTFQRPSKPLAHLSAGPKKPEKDGIMEWSNNGDSIPYELEYKDGKLIVQKEGYYYVYSKLSYSSDHPSFIQTVKKNTARYLNKPLELLTYQKRNSNSAHKGTVSNSYLGGVFYMYKQDAVFVHVSNGSLVRLHTPADNFFGMFML